MRRAWFIGGRFAESLLEESHGVTMLDNLEPIYYEGIKQHRHNVHREVAAGNNVKYQFTEGGVRDSAIVEDILTDIDIVVHQTARVGVRESMDNPQKVTGINVDRTVNLLNASIEAGMKRVILANSSSVYEKSQSLPYEGNHPTEPVGPRGDGQ